MCGIANERREKCAALASAFPIAVKDNIHTINMPTTGGALAFEGFVPLYEATLVKQLRDAGAIIIAKTGMTELANWMAGPPTPMPTNYNAVSGSRLRNPYDPRRDPRPATADGRPAAPTGGFRKLRRRHGGQLLGSQCGYGNIGVDPEPCQPKHACRY